jgi:hypothetical protein
MAQTIYSKTNGRAARPDHVLERDEYLSRARSMALRGQELNHAKLLDIDVVSIRSAAKQRENLKKHIRENLSNEALAKAYGIHVRTVEKVLSYETWGHVA